MMSLLEDSAGLDMEAVSRFWHGLDAVVMLGYNYYYYWRR
jgi:hypothetical protein